MSRSSEILFEDEAITRGLYPSKRNKPAIQPFFERGNFPNFNANGDYSVTPGIFEITSADVTAMGAQALIIWNIQLYIEQTTGTYRVNNYGHQSELTVGWQLKVYYNSKDDAAFAPFVKKNSDIEKGFPNGAGGEIPYSGGGNRVAKYWADYHYLNCPVRIRAGQNDSIQIVHNDNYGATMAEHNVVALGYFQREDYNSLP